MLLKVLFFANNKPSITIGGDLNNIIRSIFAIVLDRENSILPYVAFSFMLIDESQLNSKRHCRYSREKIYIIYVNATSQLFRQVLRHSE